MMTSNESTRRATVLVVDDTPETLSLLTETLDQAVPDRECCSQRDLLRRDRGNEALERLDRDRWPETAQLLDELREHRLARGERRELLEVELCPEELAHDRLDLRVERIDVHSSRRVGDAHFAASHNPMQPVVVPEVREVRAEGPVAGRRELEVVGLWKA